MTKMLIKTMIDKNEEFSTKNADLIRFMTSGNSVFTVENTRSNKRFTYKVVHRSKDKIKDRYIVTVLFGNDNSNNKSYRYIGLFYKDTGNSEWVQLDSPSRVFALILRIIYNSQAVWPSNCRIYRSVKCMLCGRVLTVPGSINAGIGPGCLRKLRGVNK